MSARGLRSGRDRAEDLKRLTVGGFGQARVLELIDSWSIEVGGRTNEKRHGRMRTRSRGFRRLGGDRVSPQLPQLLGKKSSDSRCAERGDLIEHRREFWFLD